MRIALLGRTRMLLEIGKRLVEEGHQLVAVFTAEQQPHYRSSIGEFMELAQDADAHFRGDGQVDERDIKMLRTNSVDIGVSINWPRLIGSDILNTFRFGILNGHAGDLPRYRGNACLNWAILNQEAEVAVVVHGMEPHEIDVGPIYARKRRALNSNDYIGDLYDWLEVELPQLFVDVIDQTDTLQRLPESLPPGPGPSLRCFPRQESDSEINWLSNVEHVSRLIRASSRPLAGAYTTLRGSRVRIWRAQSAHGFDDFCALPGQVLKQSPSGLFVACGEGVLHIDEWSVSDPRVLPARITAAVRFGSQ